MYQGFYINMEEARGRRASIESQLDALGIADRYRRVPGETFEPAEGAANPLSAGHVGCWLSHTRLLNAQRGSPVHLHVVEDDTVFAPDAPGRFERILARMPRELPDWDVLFTDVLLGQFALGYRFVRLMLARYQRTQVISIASLAGLAFGGTSSYFVNSAKIDKLADLMDGQWATGLPIDMYMRQLVMKKQLVAGVTVPFVTTLSPAHADSSTRDSLDPTGKVALLLRRSLYKDADLNQLAAEMDDLFSDVQKTPHLRLFMKAMGFFMSECWIYQRRRKSV